ncbi:MAG: IS1182 family transposase [Gammaproteobacteria bacterium]|nr:MAG: IS1182 family transposase [Gammaproteobacteria bacterium]
MRHIQGQNRHQLALLPESLDELIAEDHPVRVIDFLVDGLDLDALGFVHAIPKATGRPPYDPGDLLKLYLYGYLNQIRSSRRQGRESRRNLELMWLINRLTPDFKTIADFRRDNGEAIVQVCREFVLFCRGQRLLGGGLVAIDGSKFEASNSPRQVISQQQLEAELVQLDAQIQAWIEAVEANDAADDEQVPPSDGGSTQIALDALKAERATIQKRLERMRAEKLRQQPTTDPDARCQQGGRVGYNVQTAVDSHHQLIVHHEVIQSRNDENALYPMAQAARRVLDQEKLTVVADAGYSNGEAFDQCEDDGITPFVPVQRAKNNKGDYFGKSAFHYEPQTDCFRCPAGHHLHYKTRTLKKKLRLYTSKACGECAIKPQCTGSKQRWVSRHFHEEALARVKQRSEQRRDLMRQRRQIVEHPFGTIKRMMGQPRFLMRGLRQVKGEIALSVLAYNLMRSINVLGVHKMGTALTC